MTNLFAANIFGHHESLSGLPSKSVKKTGKKHIELNLTRHEFDLVNQQFCFDHKVLLMHSLFHQCLNVSLLQISNEVRWRPAQVTNLAAPYSNLRSFGSKCTVMKKALVAFLRFFSTPSSDLAPEELYLLSP